MNCDAVKNLLGAWWDGELGGDEADLVRKHLEMCPSCRSQRVRLERLDGLVREAFQKKAGEVRFDAFWAGIEKRIAEKGPWRARLDNWAALSFGMGRAGWAISLAAILMIGVFSFSDFYRDWLFGSKGGRTRIESIDAHGLNVAVFREAQTRTTVIWLFQDEESDDEAPEESDSQNLTL
jgi:anti-sigma factor RsiW